MIVKFVSYKNSKSFFAKLIRFKQRYINKLPKRYSRLSHSETMFPFYQNKKIINRLKKLQFLNEDKNELYSNNEVIELWKKRGLWFSSSEVDKWTRFKFINDNKWNWEYHEIEVTEKEYIKMLDFSIRQNWNAYNFFWIFFTQVLKTLWFRRIGDRFCSQITLRTAQEICMYAGIDAITVSPWQLAYMLENKKWRG